MVQFGEKVRLTEDYVDPFGFQYRKGQMGIVVAEVRAEDSEAGLLFDGYDEEKQKAAQGAYKKLPNTNVFHVIPFLSVIPLSILESVEKRN